METSSRELHAIEYIAGLDSCLDICERSLEPRLRSIPDMWRQYRIARVAVDKLLDGLYGSMEPRALQHLKKMCGQSELIFRPKSVLNDSHDSQIVLTKDIITLVGYVVESNCSMCIKTGKEVRDCELRKAMLNVAPLRNNSPSYTCGYSKTESEAEV